ncbi:MAG: ABC transporter substrate-binding protein [Eubacteriales bacterium]
MPPFMDMRNTRIILVLVLAAALIAGCSSKETETYTGNPTETIQERKTTEVPNRMEIEDMAGRMVIIPTQIETVFGTNNNSTILLYTLAPETMIAWNLDFSDAAKKYLRQEVVDLPVVGNLYGSGKEANIEEIISMNPDIVLIADVKISDKVIEAADDLQEKLGIPVLVIYANMSNYDEAYNFLGTVLRKDEKADELAAYYTEAYDKSIQMSSIITERINIYYAYLDDGLTTEYSGSPNAELIELVGATNIATTKSKETSGQVTIERVLNWNPQVILVGHKGAAMSKAYETIKTDEIWAEIGAVKNDMVFSVPRLPFNWFDRPPSVNRIIGIKWLGNLLYPEIYNYDMTEEVKEFYSLFYGCELSDEEAEKLLGN